jgi:hypothetical protein
MYDQLGLVFLPAWLSVVRKTADQTREVLYTRKGCVTKTLKMNDKIYKG